jgi:hypothetical protein
MPITNLKRKLEQARDAIITVSRQKDSAFNPYEILAILTVGDIHLGDARPESADLAKMQVELADVIFRFVASDKRLLNIVQEITCGLQEHLHASQKQRLRSAAQDGALIILSTSMMAATCLACFDLFQSRERINIAARTVKRNARARKTTIKVRRFHAAAPELFGLSDEARSDRIRVRSILSKARSTRLDRTPDTPLPKEVAPVPDTIEDTGSIPSQAMLSPKQIKKEREIHRATEMNSAGGPVLPNPVY